VLKSKGHKKTGFIQYRNPPYRRFLNQGQIRRVAKRFNFFIFWTCKGKRGEIGEISLFDEESFFLNKMPAGIATYWDFFREFVRHPASVGAIAPSSASLARIVASIINPARASVIVEYGPGVGTFTSKIMERIHPDARLIAIEKNHKMASLFRGRYPQVALFEDSVENLSAILKKAGVSKADYIVSGLPWATFNDKLQDRLMQVTVRALQKKGEFATFAYIHSLTLPAGRRFRAALQYHFSEVRQSPIVWRNLPPAFVYHCIKK